MKGLRVKKTAPAQEQPELGRWRAAGRIVTFFLAMLALTLFARGMSGAALTTVSTVHPSRGTVTESLTFSGQLESQTVEVLTLPGGLTVQTVFVTQGQEVKTGDILLQVELEGIQQALIQAQGELDKLRLQLAEYEKVQEADSSGLASAQTSYQRVQEDYQSSLSDQDKQISRAKETLSQANAALSSTKSRLETLKQEKTALEQALQVLRDTVDTLTTQLEEAQAEPDLPEGEVDEPSSGSPAADEAISTLQTQLSEQTEALSAKEQALEALEADIASAEAEVESAQNQVDAAKDALEDVQDTASDSKRSGQRSLEDARQALEEAQADYSDAQAAAEVQNQQNQADAQILSVSIAQQERQMEALQALSESGGVLEAPCDGVILSLSGTAGSASEGVELRLSAASDGYVLTLEGSGLSQLAVGASVTVTQGETTAATTLAAVTQQEDGSYTATAYLQGDGWENGVVQAEAIQSSEFYELTVPISAYHNDNQGGFLYVVVEETSVLGLRYVVRREAVTLLANDGTAVAVNGILNEDSNVILAASRSIQEGEQVRFE